MKLNEIKRKILNEGLVIPAHPLALTKNRKLDERRQRALSRYYLDAGVGGLAVGVHTTQFEIRNPGIDLYQPVLELAKEEMDSFFNKTGYNAFRAAGVVGKTKSALAEAKIATDLRYDAALLGLAAFNNATNDELIAHCKQVAEVIPIIGFYFQKAVGGRYLDVDFWREFAKIENVVAIKMAPFNRYQTFDVVRGVIESGRANEIALYTGNDDNIVVDLLAEYNIMSAGKVHTTNIAGGLLGHWSVWAQKAVELLKDIKKNKENKSVSEWLSLANKVTDANAAFFDSANDFKGCIVGLHEVLRRQGLLEGLWTLNESEVLTNGQLQEIDRVYAAYPELNDDEFVKENLDKWMA
ncbi:MAG: dihydrodipicolinate synthase family protein [Cyclobacteriaceae bacterium]|nr:dihydrodipicolinate synthase family protein [Cyclobacteriaceae bacterium]